jgi:hypothetical protein
MRIFVCASHGLLTFDCITRSNCHLDLNLFFYKLYITGIRCY